VSALRNLPFLRFERALDHIEALQDVGLETEPRKLRYRRPRFMG
jgi:hypothetical protein